MINIWALKKDIRIKSLLILLSHQIPMSRLIIDDSQQLHHQAVRLRDSDEINLSVYIFTYAQNDNHYGLELEYPDKLNDSFFQGETFENLKEDRLMEIIASHFNLACENI